MTSINLFSKRNWLYHAAFWIVYVTMNHLIRIVQYNWSTDHIYISDTLVKYGISIAIFYLDVLFIFPLFFKKRKYSLFLVLQVLILLANGYVRFFLIVYILLPLGLFPPYGYDLLTTFIISIWWWLQYTLLAFGFYFFTESLKKEKRLRVVQGHNAELEQSNMRIEQRRLRTEYAFLRAQINPHFLHNTLSLFYSKSIEGSTDELSEGILTLSEIMRYSLQKKESSFGKVPLQDEIDHIHNIIKINELRFGSALHVNFEIEGSISGSLQIPPLILITLVENAFKHGEYDNPDHPILIKLQISEESDEMVFSVFNKKKRGPKELSNGIGIENTLQRLEMAYGDKYSLVTDDGLEFYTTTLRIEFAKY